MLNIYYMSLQQSRTLFLLGDRVLISDFSPSPSSARFRR